MSFGNKLKKLRNGLSLTQSELAREIAVSDRTVSLWERNEKLPNFDKAIKLSQFFRVSLDYLADKQEMFLITSQNKNSIKFQLVKDTETIFSDSDFSEEDLDFIFERITEIYFASKRRH